MAILEIFGLFFLMAGVFFCIIGIVGLIRFPDVYCRIHASGKVATLGLVGMLLGAAFLMPETTPKALALALFVMLTSPVASHAVAAAAYDQGVQMYKPARDDLAAGRERG
jgi:multicomponent Na+:H+ antiporter subunit G